MRYALVACIVLLGTHMAMAKPVIVEREAWGAVAPHRRLMHGQVLFDIIVHHSGEERTFKRSLEKKLKALQEFSMAPDIITETKKYKPAWGDVPYHFYIDAIGRTGAGRDVFYAGDTNTDYSTDGYIQIVVEGHFDKEKPNEAQLKAFDELMLWLAAKYHISADHITGHNDHADTDCPGQNLKEYFDILRTNVDRSR